MCVTAWASVVAVCMRVILGGYETCIHHVRSQFKQFLKHKHTKMRKQYYTVSCYFCATLYFDKRGHLDKLTHGAGKELLCLVG
jgi:hypothetical protein